MSAPQPVTASDWPSLGACLDQDPELFFPAARSVTAWVQLALAKNVCARCPVRGECLRFALATGQEYGVWGGTSEQERKQMRRLVRVGSQRPPVWAAARADSPGPRAEPRRRPVLAAR
jgi:WhiB family transcriptional regulator, redox-sensing transcriptional regulator